MASPVFAPTTNYNPARKSVVWISLLAVLMLFLGVGTIGSGAYIASHTKSPYNTRSGLTNYSSLSSSQIKNIAAKVSPSVVDVTTDLAYANASAAGTGVVLNANGLIITNNHVIDGATSITVTPTNSNQALPATVVGYDRAHDIAVLKVNSASLQPARFDAGTIDIGTPVVAMGNAGGLGGAPTLAGGVVTDLDQTITASDASHSSSEQLFGMIQTNANIQPGDSGGPLVSTSSTVIGIDTAASAQSATSSANIGFAIPIKAALDIASNIIAGHRSSSIHVGQTGFLGISASPDSNSTTGVGVSSLLPAGPAAKAGLKAGDHIVAVNGRAVFSHESLLAAISPYSPNQVVTLSWIDSSGLKHAAPVTLGVGPSA